MTVLTIFILKNYLLPAAYLRHRSDSGGLHKKVSCLSNIFNNTFIVDDIVLMDCLRVDDTFSDILSTVLLNATFSNEKYTFQ